MTLSVPPSRPAFLHFPPVPQQRIPWRRLVLVVLLDILLSAFFNLVVFERGWLAPLAGATGYLVQPGLVAYAIKIPIVFAVLFGWGGMRPFGMRPSDAGLRWNRLPAGLAFTLAAWLLVQLAGLLVQLATHGSLSLAPEWAERGLARMAGIQIANLANVLFEETFFRGFLIAALYGLLASTARDRLSHRGLFFTILLSQTIFALSHIPNRIFKDVSPAALLQDQFMVLGIGALLALLYLRSGNLFVAMGVHLLANQPLSIFAPQDMASAWVYALAVLALLLWRPLIERLPFSRKTWPKAIQSS